MATEMISALQADRASLIDEIESAANDLAALSHAEIAALLIKAAEHLRESDTLGEKMRLYLSKRLFEIDGSDTPN